jgi:hypothetical protein
VKRFHMLGETLLYHFSWQSYSDFQTIIFFDYYFIIFLVAADPRSPSQLRFFDLGLISRNFLLLSRKQKKVPKFHLETLTLIEQPMLIQKFFLDFLK